VIDPSALTSLFAPSDGKVFAWSFDMFMITYKIVTLLDDACEIGRGFARMFLHHHRRMRQWQMPSCPGSVLRSGDTATMRERCEFGQAIHL
jgi:hypothetical protein